MSKSKVDILLQFNAEMAELQRAQVEMGKTRGQWLNMFRMGTAFGTAQMTLSAIVRGLQSATRAGIDFNAMLEQQQVAFRTLLGSMEAAQERMEDLTRFAASTPFQLGEIVQASKQLQALTGDALSAGDGLRLVGDAAAAVGVPFQETANWVRRLYSGLRNGAGVGEATRRLMEMGLISGELKRELDGLASSGVVGVDAWRVAEEALGRYSGAMVDQARTFKGLLSTLNDTLLQTAGRLAEPMFAGFRAALRDALILLGAVESETAAVGNRIREETRTMRRDALAAEGSEGLELTARGLLDRLTANTIRRDELERRMREEAMDFSAGQLRIMAFQSDAIAQQNREFRSLLGRMGQGFEQEFEAVKRELDDRIARLEAVAEQIVIYEMEPHGAALKRGRRDRLARGFIHD